MSADLNRPPLVRPIADERAPSRGLSAVVLAAGYSTRMGRDKALLEADGLPLWRRQHEVLHRAGATEFFLSARPEQMWARATEGFAAVLHDATPGCGPIGGLAAALERATSTHTAILAVDLPQMTAAWFVVLRAECTAGVGAVGRRDGFFEPLAAIYPREMKGLVAEALTSGQFALQPLIGRAVESGLLRVREIRLDEGPWFKNWNEGVAGPLGRT